MQGDFNTSSLIWNTAFQVAPCLGYVPAESHPSQRWRLEVSLELHQAWHLRPLALWSKEVVVTDQVIGIDADSERLNLCRIVNDAAGGRWVGGCEGEERTADR